MNDLESDSSEEEQKKQVKLQTWKSNLISANSNTVYIEQFKGSPLSIEVSVFK